ncbi:MAG: carotenoid oxygenase family protein, partial [Planctomycetota bacterium]
RTAGEGVFVPKQCPKAENDGYLLAFVHNQADVEGEFVILDCQQFDGPPLARVRMPRRVPVGFHGHWIDGANLE